MIPKDGAPFDFQGEPASYTPNPFMMVMEKGQLLKAGGPGGEEAASAPQASGAVTGNSLLRKGSPRGLPFLFAREAEVYFDALFLGVGHF